MNCPRCHNNCRIEQGEDSYYRVMRCLTCGWSRLIAHLSR